MGHNKLNIPDTLRIGYRNREDTYTGKLAYVTYIDGKGVHRKQKSWDGWRDDKIPDDTYPNEPISGLVLNKRVGGYKYSWNVRNTYCRVYDPRGFEFEISIDNLLYVLEYCSSIKGKGLEGEFVYAWDKTELVLLPINTSDYEASKGFTELQTKKVTKNDMKEGICYLNKDNVKVIYLGRHDVIEYNYKGNTTKKKHVFRYTNPEKDWYGNYDYYWFQNGFTKLAKIVNDQVDPEFVNYYQEFIESKFHTQASMLEFSPTRADYYRNYYRSLFYKDENGIYWKVKYTYSEFELLYPVKIKNGKLNKIKAELPDWIQEKVDKEKTFDKSPKWNSSNRLCDHIHRGYKSLRKAIIENQEKIDATNGGDDHFVDSPEQTLYFIKKLNKYGNFCEEYGE